MHRLRFSPSTPWLCSLSLSLLAGCGPQVTTPAGEGLTGTAIDTFDPGGQTTNTPVPADHWTEISVTSGDKSYPGTLDAGGKISVPGVPDGPYTLVLGSPPGDIPGEAGFTFFSEETARTLDLGKLHSYRPGLDVISKPTFVTITAPLTAPWQRLTFDDQGNLLQPLDDELDLLSRTADVNGAVYAGDDDTTQTGAPADGAETLSWKLDASAFFLGYGDQKPHLVRADEADDFTVVHRVTTQVGGAAPPTSDPWGNYTYVSAVEAFHPAAFTMTDGGSANLDGAFEALPQKTFSLDYRGIDFQKALADAPSQALSGAYLYVGVLDEYGSPVPAAGGVAPLLDLFVFANKIWDNPTCNPDTCDPAACGSGCPTGFVLDLPGDQKHDYPYGNPATSGQELATVTVAFRVRVDSLLPADATPESVRGSFQFDAPASELSGKPIQPILGLPRSILVNGKPTPLNMITSGVGTTPTLSFQAPSLGTPETYYLRIIALDDIVDAAKNPLSYSETVAAIQVPATETSVTVPEGVLQPGKHYYVQVSARIGDHSSGAPYRFPVRSHFATSFTGVLMP